MATLDQLFNTRRALKGHLTRSMGDIANKLAIPISDASDSELDVAMIILESRWVKFEQASEAIQLHVPGNDQASIDAEVEAVETMRDDYMKLKRTAELRISDWMQRTRGKAPSQASDPLLLQTQQNIQQLLSQLAQAPQQQAPQPQQQAQLPVQHNTRLPKLELKKFAGDITEWTTFWEGFDNSVNKHRNLGDIEKFNYLRAYLEGEALLAVSGLETTAANYAAAVGQLQACYGQTDAIVEAHLYELDNLPTVKNSNDILGLRRLLFNLQSHLNALSALGAIDVTQASFGSIMITRLLRHLPHKFLEEWTKSSANKITDLQRFLKFFREQVEASERFNRIKVAQQSTSGGIGHSGKNTKSSQQQQSSSPVLPPTAASLSVKTSSEKGPKKGKQPGKCIFCPEIHFLSRCPVPLKQKLELIAKEKRCTRCLSANHPTKDCQSSWCCRNCGSEHHTTICSKAGAKTPATTQKSNQNKSTAATVTNTQQPAANPEEGAAQTLSACAATFGEIYLKTATVIIDSPSGPRRTICLVDDGSHRSYIKESLAKELRVPEEGEELLSIQPFGSGKPNDPALHKRRSLVVKGSYPGAQSIKLSVLDHPHICGINPYRKSEFAVQLVNTGHIMADDRILCSSSRHPEDLEILIGADNIHKIQKDRVIQSSSGLRAYESKLGWLLLGPSKSAHHDEQNVVAMMVSAYKREAEISDTPSNQTDVTETTVTAGLAVQGGPDTSPPLLFDKQQDGEKSLPPEDNSDTSTVEDNSSLNFDLTLFWLIEHLGILDEGSGVDLKTDWDSYQDEITRQPGGRYVAPYPFKPGEKESLPTNLELATARLRSLLKRLKKTPGLLEAYHKEMKQLEENGFVEETAIDFDGPHTYLPHRPIIREDKLTSKIRPVMDGSAKSRDGPSLNCCLETGPNLNPNLFGSLIRFRLPRIAWIADIQQAFLNIALPMEDTEIVRCLWTDDPFAEDITIKALKWLRVSFGLNSSPFMLRAVIKKHLEAWAEKYPETTNQISQQLYVDDYLGGADTLSNAKKMINETSIIFSDAELKMRKWVTNDADLQQLLEADGLANPVDGTLSKLLTEQECHKVLGVRWDTKTDTFSFDPTAILEAVRSCTSGATKRKILQISARIFDPLGFLSPVVLIIKILFQRLWQENIGWDDPVPPEIENTWNATMAGLSDLSLLRIPRWLGTGSPSLDEPLELHVFCDASESAYGAVAYVRLTLPTSNTIQIELMSSKTRVAPLPKKKVTLPRLELLGALLGARLANTLVESVCDRLWKVTLWTDSLVALGWIRGDKTRWKPFVKNQVAKITNKTSLNWWRHCPGTENPADLSSRGAPASSLVKSELWWKGPPWLSQDESAWPSRVSFCDGKTNESINTEARSLVLQTAVAVTRVEIDWQIERISNYYRLIRRAAWVNRFIFNCRKGRPSSNSETAKTPIKVGRNTIMVECLTAREVILAETTVFQQLQLERFPEAVAALKEGRQPGPKPNLIVLRPIWDERDKLIRVTGRVELALQEMEKPPPILLPANHPVVTMLIIATHRKRLHKGLRTTLSELRERFWIIRGRQQVKGVLRTCVTCQKQQSQHFDETPAALPLARVRQARPFEVCGVDFAGPLYIRPHKLTAPVAEITSTQEKSSEMEVSNQDQICEQPVTVADQPAAKSSKKKPPPVVLEKVYVCLFTCATTRAVHIEIVRDLSAAKFLLAIRNFFALRGMSSIIYSDNAQTFTCVSRYLKILHSDPVVNDWLANNKVEWRFSASLAPWWGGFWERMVRTLKELFRKTYGRANLEFDQLRTAMAEVEFAVNSRPFTYVAEGTDDPLPITPNQLLIGPTTAPDGPPDQGCADAHAFTQQDHNRRALVLRWWTRWQKDYLGEPCLWKTRSLNSRKQSRCYTRH